VDLGEVVGCILVGVGGAVYAYPLPSPLLVVPYDAADADAVDDVADVVGGVEDVADASVVVAAAAVAA
jgi:hypothetical protein